MAAEIDVSLSVRAFEELTSISSLDDGLLSIKMRPSYNVIGGTVIRHLTGRGLIFTSSATILPSRILRTKTTVYCGTPYLVEYPPDHPTSREYLEEFLSSARAVARLDQEHWENISRERVRQDWNSSYLPSANKVKRRISLFTKEEQKRINEASKMRGLPDLSAMMATQLSLPSDEPSVSSNEMVVADTIEATLQRQDSSPGATAAAFKKKKSKKRSRDDPSVGEDLETLPEETGQTEAAEPPTKKRKKKKQSNTQQSPEDNFATQGARVVGYSARAGSTIGPTPNLALTDEPGNVSLEVPLQKKRSKQVSEQETTSRQVPSASAPSVSRALCSIAPRGVGSRQIKCGPKPLPPVADLIFQDEYVDAVRTKLLCDGVSNFVIEKYDTALKEALSESENLKRTMASKGRLPRRKRAEWQEMAEKRDRAVARRKAQKERADAAEAELSIARSTIEALELRKANLLEEMGVKAAEHKKELGRLRDSRIHEVTKERVRVETEMMAKSNKHFGNLRDWWARCERFDTARLLQSQARTAVFEISDSSVVDQEDVQDGESNEDEDDGEVDKGQGEEVDDSQVNPPKDLLEVREGETTPHIENEGADYSMNMASPGPSVGDEDTARELAKDEEE
ncbi:PREDICTED: uncharacterized protein LOC106338164 [Brassica oleracea var. oleracea]|uniref:uncharacterized protein LOC106338164 n=1 Tax=Brassica oleracea var. oleracea TaxID=109376 RepID=UPI0006A6CC08|nr:PREDICTED: uncharacterized protein LOC106338164 [Brassica oleracea var. oleracea]